jgi:phosphatidylglycerophosphate synthase
MAKKKPESTNAGTNNDINSDKLPQQYECPIDWLLYRSIDHHLSVYKDLGLTPNMVTVMSILAGVGGAYIYTKKRYSFAALLWVVAYYFDCVDGKLARRYNMTSKFGDLLDHAGDGLKVVSMTAVVLYNHGETLTPIQKICYFACSVMTLLCMINIGYQERIYDATSGKESSATLNVYKMLTSTDECPKRTIRKTRHFGCGSLILFTAITIASTDLLKKTTGKRVRSAAV